ncbi:hypothetical protein B296_00013188 [Ensete ventricosum]|uniref:Uncharacterized protein n=1 Tax=Ensete ventricosum TaxID=4639 RepID=A0A426Y2N8_ENSVE|nr:hypothetical protein B296_00013188 [Ensete ventricosum]
MKNIDLAATSPYLWTAGPPTWPTIHVGAGLTQAWKGQPSYDRPDKGKMGKVDMPQLQEGRRAPRRKDHGRRGEVRRHGIRSRPELRHLFLTRAPLRQPPTSRVRPEGSLHPTVLHLSTETTTGELAHTGQNQLCPLSRHGGTDRAYWAGTKIFH